MDVDGERERRRMVAEPVLDLLRVGLAVTEEEGAAGMAEGVPTRPRHACASRGRLEDATEDVASVERRGVLAWPDEGSRRRSRSAGGQQRRHVVRQDDDA